ncbi:MAG: hypothetical protein IJ060_08715 [Oscillospiraceae bacterium]|nr:hypothetical protein [Oscillospiraceae bacterium]
MSMVYCSKCGKLISTAAESCCRCGEPISDSAELELAELQRLRRQRMLTAVRTAAALAFAALIVYLLV